MNMISRIEFSSSAVVYFLSIALAMTGMSCDKKVARQRQSSRAVEKKAPSRETGTNNSHRDEPAHEELPKILHVSPEVIRDAKIKFGTVIKQLLTPTLNLPGEIVAIPDRSAKLSSPVAGRIEDVRYNEGSRVKKGAVLAIIRVPDLGRIRGAYTAALSRLRAANTNVERILPLRDKGLATEQSYIEARSQADALQAEAKALLQQLNAMGAGPAETETGETSTLGANGKGRGDVSLTLRAPVSGVVVERNAVIGQSVNPDQMLASIAELDELWFLGRVFEKDLGYLKVNAPAEVVLNAYPEDRFEGTIEYIGQQIDPVARTVTARIKLLNKDGALRIGLFGFARTAIGSVSKREPLLVVPRSALTEIAEKPVVFVQHQDGDFELHEVVLGEESLGLVQVLSGLREGERIVVEGTFSLKSIALKHQLKEDD